jgi:hypothetical protein
LAVLKYAEAVAPVAEFSEVSAIKAGNLALVVGRTRASGPVDALGAVSLRATWSLYSSATTDENERVCDN